MDNWPPNYETTGRQNWPLVPYLRCRARVKEQDGVYYPGETEQGHPPSTGMTEACTVKALIKSDAKNHATFRFYHLDNRVCHVGDH
ncbi:hypothetical protein LSH36_93g07065 [Paralvinella palmiformis]|uniref:Uncharacterized protein n=1 Tax=Paralvinella palmiformis TaxID=53620 RepID=A0AAD9K0Q1_9ANNE|nr:hypothetical protein LSH36_93g07065 [Paralvinella palmiformis]